jgi:hypothetical protein
MALHAGVLGGFQSRPETRKERDQGRKRSGAHRAGDARKETKETSPAEGRAQSETGRFGMLVHGIFLSIGSDKHFLFDVDILIKLIHLQTEPVS